MKRLYCALLSVLLFLSVGIAHAQEGAEPIRATDLLKIQQLGSITASQDGRSVAYTARTIVEKPGAEGEYSYRSHLFVIPVSGSQEAQQMTFGDRGGAQPAWHPDGDRLAFVREVEDKPQLFVLSLFGGEARQVTRFEHGATEPRWSPDGTRLLFAASLSEKDLAEWMDDVAAWPNERPARRRGDTGNAEADPDGALAQVRAWLDRNGDDGNPRVFSRLNLQGELDLQPTPTFRHYFVIDAEGERAPRLVTRGYNSFSGAAWMPDGQQILLSGAPVPDRPPLPHPDRVRDRDLFLADTDGSRLRLLLDLEGYALSTPRLSPDGSLLAFLARDLDDPGYAQTELGLFALEGRTPPELLTLGFDRSLSDPKWSYDNWHLFFTAPSEGGFPLYRLTVHDGTAARPRPDEPGVAPEDTLAADSLAARVPARASFRRVEIVVRAPKIERLSSPEQGLRSYDVTAATFYYVLTEAANPYEIYSSNMEFTQQRRLTEHNAAWLKDKRLSLPVANTLKRDTLRIPYWVMPPTTTERRRTYPMLLEIHGGPAAMWGPGEASMWHEFQFMAAQGYGIVYSNPRGSGGYGHAYKKLNYQDWGDGPAGDVLAVATEAARRQRWVDRDRQVVTGGSYAGYLTAWIVGHDDRFKAAVAQRGVYDLAAFFGEGNAWRLVPSHFGGYPWDDTTGGAASIRDVLAYNSPLTYVDRIRTPLLILHSDNDLRTGVTQSEALYKSLKAMERPVEYVRYPKAGHDLSRSGDPKQRIDRLLRIYEFMERYVGDGAATVSSRGSE